MAIDQVTTGIIKDNAITATKIAAGAVEVTDIADSVVTNAKLNLDYSNATYRAPTIDNSFAAATKTIKKIDATTWYTVNDILVFLNGVCLIPTTDYTVTSSGTATLTLVEGAPATATSLVVRYLAI